MKMKYVLKLHPSLNIDEDYANLINFLTLSRKEKVFSQRYVTTLCQDRGVSINLGLYEIGKVKNMSMESFFIYTSIIGVRVKIYSSEDELIFTAPIDATKSTLAGKLSKLREFVYAYRNNCGWSRKNYVVGINITDAALSFFESGRQLTGVISLLEILRKIECRIEFEQHEV